MTNVAEMLFESRRPVATPDALAEELGRLVWQGDDNGASIHRELEGWIEHGDEKRAAVALAYDEACLFISPEQMSAALECLAARLPKLVPQIEIRRDWLQENFSSR